MDKLFHSHAAHDDLVAKHDITRLVVGAGHSQPTSVSDKDKKDVGQQEWVENV